MAKTNGEGNGGNISIQSQGGVFFNDSSRVITQVQEDAVGDGGQINIESPIISLSGLSSISTNTLVGGKGTAGNINLITNDLNLSNSTIIEALTENSFDGGDIMISAIKVNLLDGAKIATITSGDGNAGNISLNVSGSINISGNNPNFNQLIDDLIIEENSENTMFSSPLNFVTPSNILNSLGASSGLFANTSLDSNGDGGNIQVNSQQFNLKDTGLLSVGSQGKGNAGSLSITSDILSLDNSVLLAEAPSGVGGSINLAIKDNIELRNSSLISARAFSVADGGNIDIDTKFLIAFPDGNNDIIASSEQGQGGNISINAESLFGIRERALNPQTNDINASSDFSLDGSITINTPDVNPVQGATELSTNIIVPEETAQQACEANRESAAQNGLNITGKGGIIPEPGLPLNSLNVTVDGESGSAQAIPAPIEIAQGKIQPARGVMITKTGDIILTAYRTNNQRERTPSGSVNCGL